MGPYECFFHSELVFLGHCEGLRFLPSVFTWYTFGALRAETNHTEDFDGFSHFQQTTVESRQQQKEKENERSQISVVFLQRDDKKNIRFHDEKTVLVDIFNTGLSLHIFLACDNMQ